MSDVHGREDSAATPKSRSVDEIDTVGRPAPVSISEPGILVGATVSRYVVLEEVGRGAMGRVLRAYDPKLQREVALKEVRGLGGPDPEHLRVLDTQATRRLVEEARAMAKLSHPNVVAVYDVEALPSGDVVLVMEYVAGQTLRQWLRAQERPWGEVVKAFVAAGLGVTAAHEAGLMHRDFKPTNVLVSEQGLVKVTDFGLAKIDPSLSATSWASAESDPLATEAGTILGTPRYMAPEQHRGESLTTSADQYAFCVALWEALCGEPPFASESMEADKAGGPPAWPRLSVPRPIVNAIVRGLSADPGDRWPTMEALVHALGWDPAIRRNRRLLGLAGVGLLAAAGVSYQQWSESRIQPCTQAKQQLDGIWDEPRSRDVQTAILGIGKSYATSVWERTRAELDAYAKGWAATHTEACEATVRGEQSAQMLDLRMRCLHRAARDLRATVETLEDADDQVVRNAHEITGGLHALSRCSDTEALAQEVEPPLPEAAEAVEAARTELARANSARRAGRYEAARDSIRRAKEALAGVEYGPVRVEVALYEGLVLENLGEYEASAAALHEALQEGSHSRQWDAMASAASQLVFVVGARQQRAEEALRLYGLAEGLCRGHPMKEATLRNNLANVLNAQGKYAEAEAEHREALAVRLRALGPDHLEVASSRNNLAVALFARGSYDEAEAEFKAAVSVWDKALGPEHPDVAMSRNNLANALYAQQKYDEAEREVREALSRRKDALGPNHPDVATSRNNLGNILQIQGKYEEAEAEQRAALSLWQRVLDPGHPNIAAVRNNLAMVLRAQGKYGEAEAEYRVALQLRLDRLGLDHADVASSRYNLGSVLLDQGKHQEAEPELRQALEVMVEALGTDHPNVTSCRQTLALVLLELDRTDEALPLAEAAWERQGAADILAEARADSAFVLGRVLWNARPPFRDRTRARALGEDALQAYRRAGEPYAEGAAEVERWLAAHVP